MECSLSTSRQGSPISQNIGKDCKQRLSSVTLYLPCHLHDFHDWSFNNCREVVKILITFITPIIVLQNLPLSLSTWTCLQTENKIILFTIFKTVYKFLGQVFLSIGSIVGKVTGIGQQSQEKVQIEPCFP